MSDVDGAKGDKWKGGKNKSVYLRKYAKWQPLVD
jgi:hypothetical protein